MFENFFVQASKRIFSFQDFDEKKKKTVFECINPQ